MDDHLCVREVFARLLRDLGYEVFEAGGPLQAQQLAETLGGIDLLLTDFHMPDMNGVELAEWFHIRFPSCKVLLVSAAPWEVEPRLTAPRDFVLMGKMEAFGRLAGIVHDLIDKPVAGSAPADSDQLRRGDTSPNPATNSGASPSHIRSEYEQETKVLCKVH